MANQSDYQVTTNEIMDFLQENMVTKKELEDKLGEAVGGVRQEMKQMESSIKEEMKQMESGIRQDMMKVKLDLIDAMDDKNADLKGDLVILMRKEDTKVVNLIELLKHKQVLTSEEARGLLTMEPFPKLFV